jgi:hypothetical protein
LLGKEQHPLNRRLGGPESQSGCLEEGENLLPVLGLEPQKVQPLLVPDFRFICNVTALHLHVSRCSYLIKLPSNVPSYLHIMADVTQIYTFSRPVFLSRLLLKIS